MSHASQTGRGNEKDASVARVDVKLTDITKLDVDAIVNAANERLLGGGGVDGAIHAAAGPALVTACRALAEVRPGVRCPTGEVRITPGFLLPARFVIHTVGPVWRGGGEGERELLASCYRNVLELCTERGFRTLAIPAISCGVYRFPLQEAARIATRELRRVRDAETPLETISLVAFDQQTFSTFEEAVRSLT
jgi:O-acetyl-ADP-ribose deacetylase (regulator of RNase III)